MQRRLARAKAVPAAERSPEMAAFIAAEALYDDVDALLPLTPSGDAALPPGPERERRLQLAVLQAARVCYLCPEPPPVLRTLKAQAYIDSAFSDSFIAGFGRATNAADIPSATERFLRSYSGSGSRQGHLVRLYVKGQQQAASAMSPYLSDGESTTARVIATAMHASALKLLSDAQYAAAVDAELEALRRSPELLPGRELPSARQLAHLAGCNVALWAGYMLLKPAQVQVAAVQFVTQQAAAAAEAVLQLEPDNPRGYLEAARFFGAAAELMPVAARQAPPQPDQRVVDLYLKAVSLGQAQGSDWWVARCAPAALLGCTPRVSLASKAAAAAAVRQAQAALRRCRSRLPDAWVKAAEGLLLQTPSTLASIEAELSARSPPSGSGGSAAAAGSPAAHAATGSSRLGELAQAMAVRSITCSGCGTGALGLRRCGGCLQAQYCSVECQRLHWPEHKKVCKKRG